jgi:hypothetical protein
MGEYFMAFHQAGLTVVDRSEPTASNIILQYRVTKPEVVSPDRSLDQSQGSTRAFYPSWALDENGPIILVWRLVK